MKLAVVTLAAALIAASLAFTSGETAFAQADACGVFGFDVPDSGATFNFTAACAAHDSCYAAFHGQGEAARKACDDQFLANMQASCVSQWPFQPLRRLACNFVAGTYYTGVRLGGWLVFYG